MTDRYYEGGVMTGQENVFGAFSFKVELYAPNGNKQRETHLERGECAEKWAKEEIAKMKADKCGNGKPLSDYPEVFNSIFGNDACNGDTWEVRVFE
jgi:hypothetical protein